MIDVQSQFDNRNIPINKVGVKNLRYPIVVMDRAQKEQHTIANVNMYVDLPHNFKGTHMSRFIEILNEHRGMVSIKSVRDILHEMKHRLHAETAHLEITFPYFIEKEAPITKSPGLMEYEATFQVSSDGIEDFILGVKVPITTLCPCSKSMSEKGAHNQRTIVNVNLRFNRFIWIEEVIELVEQSGSSPLFSMLKREDEKFVTDLAYDNPKFVEDVVRSVAEKLNDHPGILWYSIEVESLESIHNHNAYAVVEKKKLEGIKSSLEEQQVLYSHV